MAGIHFTTEMAQGAALLVAAGETLDVWIYVPGRTRFCQFAGCSDDGSQITLRYWRGGEALYADVETGRVLTSEWTAGRCLRGLTPVETDGERTVRQWLDGRGARRDLSGRYIGHHVEPAGRR